LDGLAALLDLPEVVLPVEMGPATFDDAEPVAAAQSSTGGGASGDDASSSSSSSSQRNPDGTNSKQGGGSGSGGVRRSTWTQPKVNTIIALPGADAAAIAVGAAFQSVTDVHLQRPPLDPVGSDAGPGDDRGVTG
jgi:hypothetical protein